MTDRNGVHKGQRPLSQDEVVLTFLIMNLNGSKFRKTKGGRAVVDILRTINATCTDAKLDLNVYFAYIACHKNLLKDNPELLTPYAVALALEKSAASKNSDLSQENSLTKMENLHHQA